MACGRALVNPSLERDGCAFRSHVILWITIPRFWSATLPGTPVYSALLSNTPVGTVKFWATSHGLRRLAFRSGADLVGPSEKLGTESPPPYLAEAVEEVRSYLAGELKDFSIDLDMGAITKFQLEVYEALQAVPFGTVTTYGALAELLGLGVGGARAVGQAVGANPVAIVVPCHRVVGSDNTLHGFSGGLPRKASLLRLEGIYVDGESARSRVHPGELRLSL